MEDLLLRYFDQYELDDEFAAALRGDVPNSG
jgi:hypothetical protein